MTDPYLWLAGVASLVTVMCATMGRNKDEETWSEKEGEDIDNDAV